MAKPGSDPSSAGAQSPRPFSWTRWPVLDPPHIPVLSIPISETPPGSCCPSTGCCLGTQEAEQPLLLGSASCWDLQLFCLHPTPDCMAGPDYFPSPWDLCCSGQSSPPSAPEGWPGASPSLCPVPLNLPALIQCDSNKGQQTSGEQRCQLIDPVMAPCPRGPGKADFQKK